MSVLFCTLRFVCLGHQNRRNSKKENCFYNSGDMKNNVAYTCTTEGLLHLVQNAENNVSYSTGACLSVLKTYIVNSDLFE
jgi:hypothetical protein